MKRHNFFQPSAALRGPTAHAHWITPDWPIPDAVRAVCTSRAGGVSLPPFDSLNLGDHVGDQLQAVTRNRQILREAMDARPVFLKQVHGSHSILLDASTTDGTQADGCVALERGLACTMMVADCLPILFCAADGAAVAAAHAGWRGLAGQGGRGVVESTWDCLQRHCGARAADTLVWLGPCIGPDAFEVGTEVKAAFEAQSSQAGDMFRPHHGGKWLADLQGLARQRLRALGFEKIYGNDGSQDWCTVAQAELFFSHRRDRVSGRIAAAVWRV